MAYSPFYCSFFAKYTCKSKMPSRSKCPVWLYAVVALAVVVLIGTAVALGMNESFYAPAPSSTTINNNTPASAPPAMNSPPAPSPCTQPHPITNATPQGAQCNWYLANRTGGAELSSCDYFTLPKDLHISQQMHISPADLNTCTNGKCTSVASQLNNYQCKMRNKTNKAIAAAQKKIQAYGQTNDSLNKNLATVATDLKTATDKVGVLETSIQNEITAINSLKTRINQFNTKCGCGAVTIAPEEES